MDNLTVLEQKTLNNMSSVLSPNVKLGDKLQDIINNLALLDTPVNAVKATKSLTFTGVVRHLENVYFDSEQYVFFAADPGLDDYAIEPGSILVDISAKAARASGSLTMAVQPTSGDTITLGGAVYTFVPIYTDTGIYEISIGANLAEAQANFLAAIRGTDNFNEEHTRIAVSDFVANVSTLTYRVGGLQGNVSGTISETFTDAGNFLSGNTLSGGAECSADDAVAALISAINNNATSKIVASKGTGTVVICTAKIAGESGNDIVLNQIQHHYQST